MSEESSGSVQPTRSFCKNINLPTPTWRRRGRGARAPWMDVCVCVDAVYLKGGKKRRWTKSHWKEEARWNPSPLTVSFFCGRPQVSEFPREKHRVSGKQEFESRVLKHHKTHLLVAMVSGGRLQAEWTLRKTIYFESQLITQMLEAEETGDRRQDRWNYLTE